MSYTVKEIFYSLQGEGHHSGRPAVFCRFSGCNLWSGREEDRARAQCTFCDTDFVGVGPDGGKFADAQALASRIASHWPAQGGGTPYVVCTGGEPLLQLDALLIDAGPSDQATITTVSVGLSTFMLPVLEANTQELEAHGAVLAQLDKSSGGKTVWPKVA